MKSDALVGRSHGCGRRSPLKPGFVGDLAQSSPTLLVTRVICVGGMHELSGRICATTVDGLPRVSGFGVTTYKSSI